MGIVADLRPFKVWDETVSDLSRVAGQLVLDALEPELLELQKKGIGRLQRLTPRGRGRPTVGRGKRKPRPHLADVVVGKKRRTKKFIYVQVGWKIGGRGKIRQEQALAVEFGTDHVPGRRPVARALRSTVRSGVEDTIAAVATGAIDGFLADRQPKQTRFNRGKGGRDFRLYIRQKVY